MLDRLRYWYAGMRYTYDYANAMNDHFLDYCLRHHKIIGWHDGRPVYSTFLTPGLSRPLAHFLSRRIVSGLIDRPIPGMATIAVTDVCNAKCEHCSFFTAMDRKERVLDTEEMKELMRRCQEFGVSIINILGGEPLLRKDLAEIIASIDKDKSCVSVFTNGWFLKEQARSLKKAGVMIVNVSLDAPDAAAHDKFRRLPHLFDRAVAGIKEAQRVGLLTGISTTVTQKDLESGKFEEMIRFAKEMGVNELLVFDAMPVGMYAHRRDIGRVDHKLLFSIVDKYNAMKGYPGIFCYAHLKQQEVFGCSAGRNYFYVNPYGEICPCDFTAKPVGNMMREPLSKLWKRLGERDGEYANECCAPADDPGQQALIHIGKK